MQVALSKIKQPRRKPQTLKRFRLLDLLHQNVHRKLTFLCASAGFGKTTLLIDFAEDLDAKICWYQIGAAENTLPAFFIYFVNSIQQTFPDFGEDLIGLVAENANPDPAALALAFSNEALEKIQDFTLLILDDYHVVSQIPEIVTFVEKVLEFIPDQVRVVIGSRNFYGIPSAELYIREELTTLSFSELAFTENELVDLSNQYFQIKLSIQESHQIISNTEGWIIAILLALRSKNLATAIPKFAGAKQHIFEFLDEEILKKLDPELRNFMLVSSMFPEFQVELCNHVLHTDQSSLFVQQLIDQNLFISQIDTDDSMVYRYHQLFREFLEERYSEYFSLKEVTQLQIDAADWYESVEQKETAVAQLIRAGKLEQALAFMDDLALDIYVSGRQTVLTDWYQLVHELPALGTMGTHLILHAAKVFGTQGEAEQALAMFDRIEPEFRKRTDYANLVNLLVNKGVQLRFSGQYQEALTCADEAIRLAEEFDLDRYYYFQAERVKGLSFYFLGDIEKAIKHLSLAADGIRKLIQQHASDRSSFEMVMTLADIGYITIKHGDIYAAQKSFQEAYEVSKTIRGHQGNVATSANNQAYIQYLIGNYQLSWKYYDQALVDALASGWRRIKIDVHNGRGDLLRDLHLLNKAKEQYEHALAYKRGVEGDDPFGETYLGLSEIERLEGDFNQAMYFLREAAHWDQKNITEPAYQIQQGYIYFSMEQFDLAQDAVHNAISKIGDSKASIERARAYFLNGIVAYSQKDYATATDQMKQSLKVAAQLGHDQFLVVLAREFKEAVEALKGQIEIRHFDEIIQKANEENLTFDQLHKEPEKKLEKSQVEIIVKTLGDVEVRRNNVLISSKQWKSSGARALFLYILDFEKVSKSQISLEFWPDFSQGKVNSNFHATLWRVRNALGDKDIIQYDGHAYFIQSDVVAFYDVQSFSALLQKFNRESDETERRNLGYQLIDLYGGDFLPDVDMGWADERRSELRNQFLQTVQYLAKLEFSKNHFENAKNHYLRLIKEEPYIDDHHEGLIKTMIENDEHLAAKRHYKAYEELLEKEIGIPPGEGLQSLSQTLQ